MLQSFQVWQQLIITHRQQPIASAMGQKGETIMSHALVKIWIHGVFGTKDRTLRYKNIFTYILCR